jgi:uncharacterized protein YbjQ (UPF0145 family)
MEAILNIGFFVVLLLVGLFAGRAAEKRHYRSIEAREQALRSVLVFSERTPPTDRPIHATRLVIGSVVIGEDYFKRIAAQLKSLVGGRLTAYESLMDRGRREAVLRMKEQARAAGADMVFNVRFETATITENSNPNALFSAEFIAYGTALVRDGAA